MQTRSEDRAYLSGADAAQFRIRRGLSVEELSRWLGITEGSWMQIERDGAHRTVALALSAVDRGLKPWSPDLDD